MFSGNGILAYTGLFLLSFAHEETAIIAGGFLIAEQQSQLGSVVLTLTLGVVAGDWAIYGLGAAASRLPRLARWLSSGRFVRSRAWLQDHLLFVIVVARLFPGPGILFPVFSGLGALHVDFGRFATRSAAVAAIYTPAMLYLTVLYGDVAVPHAGLLAWAMLLIIPAALVAGPWTRPLRRWASALVGIAPAASPRGSAKS